MRIFEFLSENSYLMLPSSKNPKVILLVDNPSLAEQSFKLYNPFSIKARVLKKIVKFNLIYFNRCFKLLFAQKRERSKFVSFLEKELNQKVLVSLYSATNQNKVVLQLQTTKAEIIGYLKYPLNDFGAKYIQNEIVAINTLSKKGVTRPYILSKIYNKRVFLLLSKVDGDITKIDREILDDILVKFKREDSFYLSMHPRIKGIKERLIEQNLKQYIHLIDRVVLSSTKREYQLVYEHGDFTPWNIIKEEDRYTPFDFEYFVEDGLEYFDLLKYYYQIGKLLKLKKGIELIEYIYKEVEIDEFKILLSLFLLKEMALIKEEGNSFKFEENLLTLLKDT